MTIYDNEEKEIIIPSNLGNGGINYESGYNDALDKAETLEVTENGTYEGLYDKVRVKVEGSSPIYAEYIKWEVTEITEGSPINMRYFKRGSSDVDFSYSLDGENWEKWEAASPIHLANVGDTFYLKGNNPNGTQTDSSNLSYLRIQSADIAKLKATGNLNALLGEDRLNETDYTEVNFGCLFNGGYNTSSFIRNVKIDYSELQMPATKITNANSYNAYYMLFAGSGICSAPTFFKGAVSIFRNCKNLEGEVKILSTEEVKYGYGSMFSATKITSLYAPFIGFDKITRFNYWLSGVTTTGVFYGNSAMSDEQKESIISTLPSTWTAEWVDVTSDYTNGYEDGYSKGESDVRSKIGDVSISISDESTSVTASDYGYEGFSKVTIYATDVYNNGYDVGMKDYCDYLVMEETSGNSVTVSWTPTEGLGNIYYSTDRLTWTAFGSVTIPANSKIYIKGNVTYWNSTPFVMSGDGKIKVWGHPYSIFGLDNAHTSVVTDEHTLSNLFENCTNITDVSELKLDADGLALNAYYRMFKGCTSLVNAPALPATTFNGEAVYFEMFSGCTSLTNAPVLPALTLTDRCYTRMFQNTGITSVVISVTTLPTDEYASPMGGMFDGCSALNEIRVYATEYRELAFKNWVSGVASTGNFYNNGGADFPIGTSGIPTGWTEHKPVVAGNSLVLQAQDADVNVWLTYTGTGSHTFFYSLDEANWIQWLFGSDYAVTITNGSVLYVRGDNPNGTADSGVDTDDESVQVMFNTSGDGTIKMYGKLNALLSESQVDNTDMIGICFSHLFYKSPNITDVVDLVLSGTVLGDSTYQSLFTGTNITTTPSVTVDSMTSWSIARMFDTCPSLVAVQNITINATNVDSGTFNCFCLLARSPLVDYIDIKFASLEGIGTTWCESAKETGVAIFPKAVEGQTTNLPSTWTIIYE